MNRNQPLPAMLAISLFGHKSVLTQTEISHSQILKPSQNRQKSVLMQTEISHSQILKPLQNQQKSVLTQIEMSETLTKPKPAPN
jgi:hypothetical protein